ncbi:hypothetical protein J6TS2_48480 [Heyndrickxia sporothermodurans]|nr:hypothetical protein J6TS2_48480 [Heyndrickxia sporothermodurans]
MKRTIVWLSIIIGIVFIYGAVDYVQTELKNKAKNEKKIELKKLKNEMNKDWKKIISKEKKIGDIELESTSLSMKIYEIEEKLETLDKDKKNMTKNQLKNYKEKEKLRDSLEVKRGKMWNIYRIEIIKYRKMIDKYNKKLKKASKIAKEVKKKWDLHPVSNLY